MKNCKPDKKVMACQIQPRTDCPCQEYKLVVLLYVLKTLNNHTILCLPATSVRNKVTPPLNHTTEIMQGRGGGEEKKVIQEA
jgi:hypothetical protein